MFASGTAGQRKRTSRKAALLARIEHIAQWVSGALWIT